MLTLKEWLTLLLFAVLILGAGVAALELTRDDDVHSVYDDPHLGRR